MERRTLDVDDEPLSWLEHGTGPGVVVFLHGIPTGPELWRSVIPLVTNARCLAFEMLGYADSMRAGAGRDISLAAQAGRVVRWLDTIGVDCAVLVGHDLGGGVAQIVTVNHPERVSGLVLTNAVAYDSWPIPSVKAMRAAGSIVARMPAALFRPVLEAFIRIGHDDSRVAGEAARVHWAPYSRGGGASAFVRQIRSLDTRDTLSVADRLGTLDLPARIVWAAADRFQKLHYGERLASDLRAPLVKLEHAKHFVPEDHPDAITTAVNDVSGAQGVRR